MKRLTLVAILLVSALSAYAGPQHPNQRKGFNAENTYQFLDLDTINLFSGNLTVRLPIGQSYPLATGLSYQLGLTCNANIWDTVSLGNQTNPAASVYKAVPDRRSNAGIGCLVSLGRLIPPNHVTGSHAWVYESADGAEHHFFETLHTDAGEINDAAEFTRDGSYLRMVVGTGSGLDARRSIEFPNGEIHEFAPSTSNLETDLWRLIRITNRFPENHLDISYTDDATNGDEWTLTDTYGRTHHVRFAPQLADGTFMQMVSSIELAVFDRSLVDPASTFSATATYNFHYTSTELGRPAWGGDPKSVGSSVKTIIPLLTKIELPAEDTGGRTAFEFLHYTATTNSDRNGLLRRMKLPTLGCIAWKWDNYTKPVLGSLDPPHKAYSTGVIRRTLYDRNCPNDTDGVDESDDEATSGIATWAYKPQLENGPITALAKEMTNTVTDPTGHVTVNYFSVATDATEGWDPKNYGLPFTQKFPDGNRFLSRKYYVSSLAVTNEPIGLKRSEYVRYERDTGDSLLAADQRNVRLLESKTVYNDDQDSFVLTQHSNFDGFGHYRTTSVESNVSESTTIKSTTMYNQGAGTYPGPLTMPSIWILDRYAYTTVTENQQTIRTDYVFNGTTGFLERRRRLRDTGATPVPGAHDVLEVFTADDRGNVAREEYYGGDAHSETGSDHTIGAESLATLTLPAAAERVAAIATTHAKPSANTYSTYSYYLDASNEETGAPFVDLTVDKNTGLVSRSRDIASLETQYGYDWAGRPTFIKSPGRATTRYSYSAADLATATHAAAVVTQVGSVDETKTRTKVRYGFDDLGRLTDEWQTMPGGAESQRQITYDKLGNRATVSELGDITALTKTTYDLFGRPTSVEAPDTSTVNFAYVGVRQRTQTSSIKTPLNATQAMSKVEQYDGHGRLLTVREQAGPTSSAVPVGAEVVTRYRYGVGGQLRHVRMGREATGAPQQERIFDYDGRGFLRWESHPESGLTSYTYDARGKVLRKRVGAVNSAFDLKNTYDIAERLVEVAGRDPLSGAFRTVKEFGYASANDVAHDNWQRGKLITAARYNYGNEFDPVYVVRHWYIYDDDAGRMRRRDTTISKKTAVGDWQLMKSIEYAVNFNDIDLVESVSYPMCIGCGAPPVSPLRDDETLVYGYGRLEWIEGVVGTEESSITYWPNGMLKSLPHANGISDKQEVGTMPRPTEISFRTYDRCVAPTITSQPKSAEAGASGALLTVVVTGTGLNDSPPSFRYEWRNASTFALEGTTQAITVNPQAATDYYVEIYNACGKATSQRATVTPSGCVPPSTGSVVAVRQPDGAYILHPYPRSRPSPQFAWRKAGETTVIASTETLRVAGLTSTTTYTLTITDACGSASSSVTVVVPLQITKTALSAMWDGSSILVSWPGVSGATSYGVERRTGAAWGLVATVSTPSFTDTDIELSRTYAYRVVARSSVYGGDSEYSNTDVATTKTYPVIAANTPVTTAAFDNLLDAVNRVRAAAGWPSATWASILAPREAAPQEGEAITANHILACRARMAEALQAVGAKTGIYQHADPTLQLITAATLNEILEQTR